MKYIFLLLTLLSYLGSYSQIVLLSDLDSDFYQLRVKTPDEFMQRFNYTQTPRGKRLIYSDSLKSKRIKYVQTLFDRKLLEKANKNDTLGKTIIDFINATVVDSTQFLSYYSNKWYAEVRCKVLFENKINNISLILETETNEKKESKWVIKKVKANILDIKAKDSTKIIGPVNHNLNFMELLKMSNRYNNSIINFKSKDYNYDNLSVFYYLVHTKKIKIIDINKVIFHFFQIPNYYFRIENINRASSNAGWLITEIKKI